MAGKRHRAAVFALFVACMVGAGSARADDLTATDREMAKLLSATPGHLYAKGTLAGFAASWSVDSTSSRNARTSWVALRLKMTSDPGFLLMLRKPSPDDEALKKTGKWIDVEVGDAGFDAAYVVEGAPSDLVRAVLDDAARKAVLAEDRATLTIDPDWFEVTVPTLESPDEADRFVAIASTIGAHLHAGIEAAPGTELSAADRNTELAKLHALRKSRQPDAFFFAMMGFAGAGAIGFVVWNIRSRRRVPKVVPPARR